MRVTFIGALMIAVILVLSACATAASEVRPEGITAGDAIGEEFRCTEKTLKGDISPFTADWSDSQRAALESAMKRGVAVVKMSCDGPEVLKACMVVGNYAYSGVSLKTKLVKMQDLASAAINLGSSAISPTFKSALSQGRSLNLAYMIAGAETTTVASVSPVHLKGRCAGATHFVYEAQLGAFSMETAEQGESKTAAEFFVGDASAETISSKETHTTDGDPESCKQAGENDLDKTEGCSALMRVDLMSISAAEAEASSASTPPTRAPRAVGCPAGYTWDDNACQPAAQIAYSLCDVDDEDGCLEQCERGSMESCNRFAQLMLFDLSIIAEVFEPGSDEEAEEKAKAGARIARHLEPLSTACDEEMPDACTAIAYHHELNEKNMFRAADFFGRACILGDGAACRLTSEAARDTSWQLRITPVDIACRRGLAQGCAIWVEEMARQLDSDIPHMDPTFPEKAARACYGGFADHCLIAAGLYLDAERCIEITKGSVLSGGKDISEDWAEGTCWMYESSVEDDLQAAERLLRSGCDNGDAGSCEQFAALFGDAEINVEALDP